MIVAIAIAIAIALAAGAALFAGFSLLFSGSATGAAASMVPSVPVYFALETMTVNLAADDGPPHLLRLGLTFKCADLASRDALQQSVPEIRSRIVLALSEKTPAEVLTPEGKAALREAFRAIATRKYSLGEAAPEIEDVLYTEFVVQ